MSRSTDQFLDSITSHSRGLADAAHGRLDVPVEHCPGWSMADLVAHVTGVHWFWRTIAGELLGEPPDASRRPDRASDDALVDTFLTGAQALVDTLRAADQGAACWTWAPGHQDVAFVTRHQVQEAAVHHFDAANAAGLPWAMLEETAADAVEEFLTVSVSSEADPADPPCPPLDGTLLLTTPSGRAWLVADGSVPGTLAWQASDAGCTADVRCRAAAADLLLWLYGRADLTHAWDTDGADAAVLDRFRALCFTD